MADAAPFSFAPNPMLAGRRPGATFDTPLKPLEEMAYRQWVAQNKVPTNPDATAPQDYDMRGFYQGIQQQNPIAKSAIDPNDSRMHYPDFWKTPLHQTFSNQSQWAPATAPQWTADDKLIAPNGRILFDDRRMPSQSLPGKIFGAAPSLEQRLKTSGVPLSANVIDNRNEPITDQMRMQAFMNAGAFANNMADNVTFPDTTRRASSIAKDAGINSIPPFGLIPGGN